MKRACKQVIVTGGAQGIDRVVTKPMEELTPDEWNRAIATNLTGTFYCSKYLTPSLTDQLRLTLISKTPTTVQKISLMRLHKLTNTA